MRQIKTGAFVLEGFHSFATTFYFYYVYFFMERRFDFGNKSNLLLAAGGGLLYVPAAYYGGKFAQRAGYFTALKLGFAILLTALLAGWLIAASPAAHILVMLAGIVGICLTWPTLEALVSEGEAYEGLQRNVGIYNVVWAGTAAVAYFVGGAMLDRFGFNTIFIVPVGFMVVQLAMVAYLEHKSRLASDAETSASAASLTSHPHPPAKTRAFMRMAWLTNPFAYIAINTLVAVMPGVANRLELSTTLVGFYCSLWCFARVAAFLGLWLWPGWHYRFRWLLVSYLALIVSFATILLVPDLTVVLIAQLAFGWAIGLIYYSSLFYSMDVGETKGEHGGIHEAAIGLGNFAGPAVGAASLHFLPQYPASGAMAVSALLVLGFGGLLTIWRMAKD
jgi:predicted MFS family arabinose efflux permease